jgi:3-isopropylmalate/(R)-2-methylmalate dehydratase large subunit
LSLTGRFQKGVGARDASHHIIHRLGAETANYKVIEYAGDAVHAMSMSERMILCSVSAESGAKAAVVEPDDTTLAYLNKRAKLGYKVVRNDPDAHFDKEEGIDLSTMEPMVAAPPSPDNVLPITEIAGKRVDSAYIGSCVSGTIDELRSVAAILKNRKIHPDVSCLIVPSTQEVFSQAAEEGLISIFVKAGACILGPTCAPCYGNLAQMADGEVRIATATRNEHGRMGSPKSEIYLASALTVAVSAVKGAIADPREFVD